jgi:hypothetical protein
MVEAIADLWTGIAVASSAERTAGCLTPRRGEEIDRVRQVEAIQNIVERIGYDAESRLVSVRFHPAALTADEAEARA